MNHISDDDNSGLKRAQKEVTLFKDRDGIESDNVSKHFQAMNSVHLRQTGFLIPKRSVRGVLMEASTGMIAFLVSSFRMSRNTGCPAVSTGESTSRQCEDVPFVVYKKIEENGAVVV